VTESTASNTEKKEKRSTIGKLIGRIIDAEKWTTEKVIILIVVLLLPFGPLAVGLYFGIKEYIRVKKQQKLK